MLRREGTQGDPADPRLRAAPSCGEDRPDAEGPAPSREPFRRDADRPLRWEENKSEGTNVAVGHRQCQVHPMRREEDPPEKKQTRSRGDTAAGTAVSAWGEDLPTTLGGTRQRKGRQTLWPRVEEQRESSCNKKLPRAAPGQTRRS